MLCVLVFIGALFAQSAGAGWVETKITTAADGSEVRTTLINVKLWQLPDSTRTGAYDRAQVAGVKEFRRRFGEIFDKRYRERYKKYAAQYRAAPTKYPQYRFYAEHEWDRVEIRLHMFSGIRIEGMGMDSGVLMAIAGGVAPDIMYVNFRQSSTYIDQGFLYPLGTRKKNAQGEWEYTGYFGEMSDADIEWRVPENVWEVIDRRGPDGQKNIWAMPYRTLNRVAVFRKDLFDANNVPYPTPDWTWDDYLDALRRITDPKHDVWGAMGGGVSTSWDWIHFLWSAGGEVMSYDEDKDEWRAKFDSREAAVALDFWIRLWTEQWTDRDGRRQSGYMYKGAYSGQDPMWANGKIGIRFEYLSGDILSTINPDVTGIVPVPIGPNGNRGAELNCQMMGLHSKIDNPIVRDAAWEYMRFYESPEAARIKTRVMVEGGMGRFLNPKYLERFGYDSLLKEAPKGWRETFEITMKTSRPEPYGRNSQLVYDMLNDPLEKAAILARSGGLPADTEARLDKLQEILRTGVAVTNEKMIGIIAPEDRRLRGIVAAIVLLGIVVGFGLVFRRIFRAFTPPQAAGTDKQPVWGFRKYRYGYLILLPAVLLVFTWKYIPLIIGSVMAFQDYRILDGFFGSGFVWLDNFGDVLWDVAWWKAIWNSIRYSFFVVTLTFIPPVILAILLQEVPKGKILFRTIFYLPAVITGLVVIFLWRSFYTPTEYGLLNRIVLSVPALGYYVIAAILFLIFFFFARRLYQHRINRIGTVFLLLGVLAAWTCVRLTLPMFDHDRCEYLFASARDWGGFGKLFVVLPDAFKWLEDPDTAMFCCVLPMVWAGMGPGCLIYLAALKGIADDIYEAADIDGATFIDKILFIVFPSLKALLIINFVGVFINAWLTSAGMILAMTAGRADTEVAGLRIFYTAYMYLKFGHGTAMAWMLGFMLIGFTVYQLRILSRLEFRTTGAKK